MKRPKVGDFLKGDVFVITNGSMQGKEIITTVVKSWGVEGYVIGVGPCEPPIMVREEWRDIEFLRGGICEDYKDAGVIRDTQRIV